MQQGAGGVANENRIAGGGGDKLVELMARMDTIRHSIGSSEEAVRAAALAADMSGRSGVVVLNDHQLDATSSGNGSMVGAGVAESADEGYTTTRKSSSFMVVPGAPSTEFDVPPPLDAYEQRDTGSAYTAGNSTSAILTAADAVMMSPQPNIECDVPAPGSPVRGGFARAAPTHSFSSKVASSSPPASPLAAATQKNDATMFVG